MDRNEKWLKEILVNTRQLEHIAKLLEVISRKLSRLDHKIETAADIDIVRCRDCRYWHKNMKGNDGIPIADMCYDFQADDFCSYGERRE